MADHVKQLQRAARHQEVGREIGWFEVTVFLVLLLGIAVIAFARATAP